jgi:hypothetical protein
MSKTHRADKPTPRDLSGFAITASLKGFTRVILGLAAIQVVLGLLAYAISSSPVPIAYGVLSILAGAVVTMRISQYRYRVAFARDHGIDLLDANGPGGALAIRAFVLGTIGLATAVSGGATGLFAVAWSFATWLAGMSHGTVEHSSYTASGLVFVAGLVMLAIGLVCFIRITPGHPYEPITEEMAVIDRSWHARNGASDAEAPGA